MKRNLEVGVVAPYGCSGDVIHLAPKTALLLNDGHGIFAAYQIVWKCGYESTRASLVTENDALFQIARKCESCFRPEIVKAKRETNKLVKRAMDLGAIQRAMFCETCGKPDTVRTSGRRELVAHHDDYNKPLKIRWLCRSCHAKWHRAYLPALPRLKAAS